MANKRIKDLSTTAAVTASDDFIAVDGATNGTRKLDAYNPTFGGNLTVSGSIVNQNGIIQSTLAAGALISSLSTNNNAVHGFQISGSGTGSRDWRLEQGRAGANSFSISNATGGLTTPLIVNGATDNILIGCSSASSDSGNGKLQLATHTSSAGGIGFGTETSLYRYGGGILGLDHIGGSVPGLTLLANGTRIISIYGASNSLYLDTFNAAGAMYLRTGAQTTALTLDSSQNATFAGAILSVGSGSNNAVCRVTASNGKTSDFGDDTTGGFVRANNSQSLRFITNSIAAITIDTSQDTTFSGQIVATKTTGAFRIATAETPASASATGTIGTIAWDTSYIYVCTAANTWKRVAIATW